jgi:hypothetical protein
MPVPSQSHYGFHSFPVPLTILEEKIMVSNKIKVITKLPNSKQSYKGKVKTHNYINRQNQSRIFMKNFKVKKS